MPVVSPDEISEFGPEVQAMAQVVSAKWEAALLRVAASAGGVAAYPIGSAEAVLAPRLMQIGRRVAPAPRVKRGPQEVEIAPPR